jgi:hypothetical protein
MVKRIVQIVFIFACLLSVSMAGENSLEKSLAVKSDSVSAKPAADFRISLLGDDAMRYALPSSPLDDKVMAQQEQSRKSPILAGVFSLILPGAGEFYSESYIKSGIFLAAEVASWIVYFSYTKKGDDQTDFFQNFADEHWSVVRYVEWIMTYRSQLNPDVTNSVTVDPNTNLRPWQRVNWDQLNALERAIGARTDVPGSAFSHTLPPYGEQQYFELIGKYPQFSHGWDDSDPNTPVYYDNLSPTFTYYSKERGKANDFYSVASTAVAIVVVNHILSAIDGAWSASNYNKPRLEIGMKTNATYFGVEMMPVAKLTVKF